MFFVKIVNGEVTEVIDSLPTEDVDKWRPAIEVHPPIVKNRQVYEGHYFDITKTPVEIVYKVEDVSVEARKFSDKLKCASKYQMAAMEELRKIFRFNTGSATAITTAIRDYRAEAALIDAMTTHEELDTLEDGK
jgi:hypothetical protein